MAIGIIGIAFMNIQKIQLFIVGNEKIDNTAKIAKVNHYKIDPNIKDKSDYFVESRLKSIYTELAKMMILRDKEIRKRLMFVKDMQAEEIQKRMSELEPFYDKERQKLEEYCINGSKNCAIEVSLTGDSVEGSDVALKVNYKLDKQSLDFFNEVHYVNNSQEKWYSSRLTNIIEKRHYPQMGKFQDRKQDRIMKDDLSNRVDISYVLEGNSNQWNVQFKPLQNTKI